MNLGKLLSFSFAVSVNFFLCVSLVLAFLGLLPRPHTPLFFSVLVFLFFWGCFVFFSLFGGGGVVTVGACLDIIVTCERTTIGQGSNQLPGLSLLVMQLC